MTKIFFGIGMILLCCTAVAQYKYPVTPMVDSTNTYFGVTYHDPYRWLEHIKDPQVVGWFKDQTDTAASITNKLSGREELVAELLMLDKIKPATTSYITYEGGRYFYNKRLPGEKVAKLYYRQGLDGREILLFDPLTYMPGKTLSIRKALPSHDGKKIAIAYCPAGTEISSIGVMDIATRQFFPGVIYPSWDGATSWTYDNNAFTYSWFRSGDNTSADMEINGKTKFHVLGTDVKTDLDFFSNESYPKMDIPAKTFPDARLNQDNKKYIFAKVYGVQGSRDFDEYYAPIAELMLPAKHWKVLSNKADNLFSEMEYYGDEVFSISLKNASHGKLLMTNLQHPDWNEATVIAPEDKDMTLTGITRSKDYLFLTYNDGINDHLFKYNFITKKTIPVKLPFVGTTHIQCLDKTNNICLLSASSWIKDVIEYTYDAQNDITTPGAFNRPPKLPAAYNDLVTEEVLVPGHDGELIPLSLIYKKGLKKDGQNTCLMEGYGAYGSSITSGIDIIENALAVRGVIVAIAHPRGGGEKGDKWYKGGYKTTKPNTWKDFISCAEYLLKAGYTSSNRLAGIGTSAGGVLISRSITERPDLFAAAICNVGIANAMRFETTPNGPMNIDEFGTVADSVQCASLYQMDGTMHVVKGTRYPAVMCIAGWNDPRVIPWQPGKFAAALQNASTSGKPVLMKVNYDSGHFTEDKSVTYRNFADMYAFVLWQCGDKGFQVK